SRCIVEAVLASIRSLRARRPVASAIVRSIELPLTTGFTEERPVIRVRKMNAMNGRRRWGRGHPGDSAIDGHIDRRRATELHAAEPGMIGVNRIEARNRYIATVQIGRQRPAGIAPLGKLTDRNC